MDSSLIPQKTASFLILSRYLISGRFGKRDKGQGTRNKEIANSLQIL